jgi:hypothetical protein
MKKVRKPLRAAGSVNKVKMWDAMPWKPVNVEHEALGEFEEDMFFGLEELDGNAYLINKDGTSGLKPVATSSVADEKEEVKVSKKDKSKKRKTVEADAVDVDEVPSEVTPEKKSKKVKKTPKEKSSGSVVSSGAEEPIAEVSTVASKYQKEEILKDLSSLHINAPATLRVEEIKMLRQEVEWAPGLKVSKILKSALDQLGFHTPTPIQCAAIPLVTVGDTDIVGAAETGSGKTLVCSILSLLHFLSCMRVFFSLSLFFFFFFFFFFPLSLLTLSSTSLYFLCRPLLFP